MAEKEEIDTSSEEEKGGSRPGASISGQVSPPVDDAQEDRSDQAEHSPDLSHDRELESAEQDEIIYSELAPDEFVILSMREHRVDKDTVERYAEDIKAGHKLPLIEVFKDRETGELFSGDGVHRAAAYSMLGRIIPVKIQVVDNAMRAALRKAWKANFDNGLPRSNADKRNAVNSALDDENARKWSPKSIKEATGTSITLVRNIMKERKAAGKVKELPAHRIVTASLDSPQSQQVGDTGQMPTPDSVGRDEATSTEATDSPAHAAPQQGEASESAPPSVGQTSLDLAEVLERLRRLPDDQEWTPSDMDRQTVDDIIKQARRLAQHRPPKSTSFDLPALQAFRERHNLNLRQLGSLLGTSHVAVSRWFSGKAIPNEQRQAAIVSLLKLNDEDVANRLKEVAAP